MDAARAFKVIRLLKYPGVDLRFKIEEICVWVHPDKNYI